MAESDGNEKRNISVCIWHDVCHETVASMKQNIIDLTKDNHEEHREMAQMITKKSDGWIMKLFLATFLPVAIAVMTWAGYNAFETVRVVTRLDVNQQRMMQDLNINPVKK